MTEYYTTEHHLNKDEADKRFKSKMKYHSRGVTNGDNLFKLILNYHDGISVYVSDLELENIRLVIENNAIRAELESLKEDYKETSNELISGLLKRVQFINKKHDAKRLRDK